MTKLPHLSGCHCDPATGTIYGLRGLPVGRVSDRGYWFVNIRPGFTHLAHRLIWESVNGPIPAGKEINHINGIKTDNRIENLELVTRSENNRHAYALGLKRVKIPETDVQLIKESTESFAEIAARYGVNKSHIGKIRRGQRRA